MPQGVARAWPLVSAAVACILRKALAEGPAGWAPTSGTAQLSQPSEAEFDTKREESRV